MHNVRSLVKGPDRAALLVHPDDARRLGLEHGKRARLRSRIGEVETPAIAFFLTLPAPVPALDAWETMEPAAQRMADLLDGVVLDEERSALGRQRIQHIRDELRAYDRQNAAPPLGKSTRW